MATIDPKTGIATPGTDQTSVTIGKNGKPQTSYDQFTNNMLGLLTKVQNAGNNPQLMVQDQNLKGVGINLSDPNNALGGDRRIFQGMTPDARVAAERASGAAFDPGILSIENQQKYNAQAAGNEANVIHETIAAEKPIATGLSDNLTSPGGETVSPGFNPTIDPNTGLPYGYRKGNTTTSSSSSNSNSGGGSTVVGGVNFGDSRSTGGLGAYSGSDDPTDYAGHISTIYKDIYSIAQDGQLTPQAIDQYIANQNLPSKSPLTGSMIMNAAATYGVDPGVLAATLNHESSFGTAGQGAKTNNPGNQQVNGGDIVYPTMQQGINATAKNLSHRLSKGSTDTASPGTGFAAGNAASVDAIKAKLPVTIQNGVRATNSGIPYINLGEVSPGSEALATTQAAKLGIKAFSENDAKGIEALNTIGQALNQVTVLAQQQLLPAGGGIGKGENAIRNFFGSTTGTNPKLADFALQKDSAIKAVTALAGGAGSGLRLNTGTIDAAVSNFPTMYDSREQALEKIDKMRDLLNVQLGTAFGNPAIGNGLIQYNGHSYNAGDTVVNTKGQIGTVNKDGSITLQ